MANLDVAPANTAVARVVILVEGESDRVALETVAALLGRDLTGVGFVVLGGATNVERVLRALDAEGRFWQGGEPRRSGNARVFRLRSRSGR